MPATKSREDECFGKAGVAEIALEAVFTRSFSKMKRSNTAAFGGSDCRPIKRFLLEESFDHRAEAIWAFKGGCGGCLRATGQLPRVHG